LLLENDGSESLRKGATSKRTYRSGGEIPMAEPDPDARRHAQSIDEHDRAGMKRQSSSIKTERVDQTGRKPQTRAIWVRKS
jgi:hypothetical protein